MLLKRNLHKSAGVWEPIKDWFLDLSGNAESQAHHIYALTGTRLGSLHLGLATILKYPRDMVDKFEMHLIGNYPRDMV